MSIRTTYPHKREKAAEAAAAKLPEVPDKDAVTLRCTRRFMDGMILGGQVFVEGQVIRVSRPIAEQLRASDPQGWEIVKVKRDDES